MTQSFLNVYLWCLKMKNSIKSVTGLVYGWTEDSSFPRASGDDPALGFGRDSGTEDSFGDIIKGYNKFGKLVGEYRKSSDTTYDGYGKPVYKGNALAHLIIDD